jgi:hypothetical protein
MEHPDRSGMEQQRKETEILKKEISELRERMFRSNQQVEPESLPASTLGRKLGTIGSKFKSLTRFRDLG